MYDIDFESQIIGTCLINQLDTDNKWGRLVGVWLLGSYPVGFMVILGLLSTNIAGSTKRSVASGWVFVCYCIGQISGPQFFKSTEAPEYRHGIVAMLCGFILNLVLNEILRFIYVKENSKRERSLEGKSAEEIAALDQESQIQGFEDYTDKTNVSDTGDDIELMTELTLSRLCFGMFFDEGHQVRLLVPGCEGASWEKTVYNVMIPTYFHYLSSSNNV